MMGMGVCVRTNGRCPREDADQVFAASADKTPLGFAAPHAPLALAGCLCKGLMFRSSV